MFILNQLEIMANSCKFYKQQRFVSYNSGATWQPLNEYRRGAFIEAESTDCQGITRYRWNPSGYTCIGYDKWQLSVYQVSNDNGATWQNVTPLQTSATTLVESNSEYCGYVPSTPEYKWVLLQNDFICDECETPSAETKFQATYSDSTTYSAECDSNTTLSTTTTKGHSTSYTAMTSAVIGDCITYIGSGAFRECSSLTSVVIPNGITTIGEYGFYGCGSLTSVTIPNSVTRIINGAFKNCSGLTSITVEATTPPTLGVNKGQFDNTNNCPIYVPSEKVNTYKNNNGWSTYASRIQAIPNS